MAISEKNQLENIITESVSLIANAENNQNSGLKKIVNSTFLNSINNKLNKKKFG